MLIVSQDRDMIVNFNNIESIGVCDGGMRGSSMIRVHFSENSFIDIARYKTKDRAIEELEAIEATYDVGGKLYSMPKE